MRRGLADRLPGRKLREVSLQRHDLRWPIPVDAVHDLVGRKVSKVERRSKYLQVFFSGADRPVALIHLGMSGQLFLDPVPPEPEWRTHEHWRMDFGDRLLRYVDPRRFGSLDVTPASELDQHKLIRALGPEPLSDQFDGDGLHRRTRRRRVAVKTYLMNAREVVGIGNIYASEACYRAGVRPGRGIYRTTRDECHRLVAAVQEVLEQAIEEGGTTLRDYVGVDEDAGYFQQSLAVYGRDGEPCLACGEEIKHFVQAARSTYYCPRCQR